MFLAKVQLKFRHRKQTEIIITTILHNETFSAKILDKAGFWLKREISLVETEDINFELKMQTFSTCGKISIHQTVGTYKDKCVAVAAFGEAQYTLRRADHIWKLEVS